MISQDLYSEAPLGSRPKGECIRYIRPTQCRAYWSLPSTFITMLAWRSGLSLPLSLWILLVSLAGAQEGPSWTATPFNPPALPLIVRSPYLSTWLPQGNKPASVADSWATFWTTGLPGYIVSDPLSALSSVILYPNLGNQTTE